MLSGKELVALAKKMVAATDPTEALEIREQMVRRFYGGKPDAYNTNAPLRMQVAKGPGQASPGQRPGEPMANRASPERAKH